MGASRNTQRRRCSACSCSAPNSCPAALHSAPISVRSQPPVEAITDDVAYGTRPRRNALRFSAPGHLTGAPPRARRLAHAGGAVGCPRKSGVNGMGASRSPGSAAGRRGRRASSASRTARAGSRLPSPPAVRDGLGRDRVRGSAGRPDTRRNSGQLAGDLLLAVGLVRGAGRHRQNSRLRRE